LAKHRKISEYQHVEAGGGTAVALAERVCQQLTVFGLPRDSDWLYSQVTALAELSNAVVTALAEFCNAVVTAIAELSNAVVSALAE
jgi:hypothetical protein